jgi:DNA-binding NarL/FixJ family response regulator
VSIRILLLDDQELIRKGIRALIELQPDMEVIAEAREGQEALRLAKKLSPDVVITNMTMPGWNGIEVTRRIVAELPATKVVVLSFHDEKPIREAALRAGASAYILKGGPVEDLLAAIRAAVKEP